MPSTLKIVLRKNKRKANGECPIALRITKDRISTYISLGLNCKDENWNDKREEFRQSKDIPFSQKWNEKIKEKREAIRLRIFDLESEKPNISAKEIKEILTRPEGEEFLEYVRKQSALALEERDFDLWERRERLRVHFEVFQGNRPLYFEDLSPRLILQFEAFLIRAEKNVAGAHGVLAVMREILQKAIHDEMPTKMDEGSDPFAEFEFKNDFIAYVRGRMDRLIAEGRFRTYQRHKTLVKHLVDFLNKGDQERLYFESINVSYLQEFEHHLVKKKIRVNTRHTYLKTFRTCLYEAIRADLFPQEKNPFFKFSLKKEKVRKPKLSLGQIKKMEELDLKPGSTIWHARNCFLFMFYCAGMRVGDLIQLRWMNVFGDRLRFQMEKTNKPHAPKLIEPALRILEQYRNPLSKPSDFIFPFLSNEKDYSDVVFLKKQISSRTTTLNKELKRIGSMIGLDFPLTNHIARHSFTKTVQSQEAKELGVDVHGIQGALAHSSVSITENYLEELDDESLDHVMDSFAEILKNRETDAK